LAVQEEWTDWNVFENMEYFITGGGKKINEIITKKEFDKLLEVVLDNKKLTFKTGIIEVKNKKIYKDYIISGIKLALITGNRRQEYVHMKWSSISLNEDTNELLGGLIEVEDFKTNNQAQRFMEEEKRFLWTRINKEIYDF
jgi:hypothetical protein